jgi:hypothetical protein
MSIRKSVLWVVAPCSLHYRHLFDDGGSKVLWNLEQVFLSCESFRTKYILLGNWSEQSLLRRWAFLVYVTSSVQAHASGSAVSTQALVYFPTGICYAADLKFKKNNAKLIDILMLLHK